MPVEDEERVVVGPGVVVLAVLFVVVWSGAIALFLKSMNII